jgi:hypothetical protein
MWLSPLRSKNYQQEFDNIPFQNFLEGDIICLSSKTGRKGYIELEEGGKRIPDYGF